MSFPYWTPRELLALYKQIEPRTAEEARRRAAYVVAAEEPYDKKDALMRGELHIGRYFVGDVAQLNILVALMQEPRMRAVWKSLERRDGGYTPIPTLYGDQSQPGNLFGACVAALVDWINLPKRTKVEAQKIYENIASQAYQLAMALLTIEDRELLDTRTFIDRQHRTRFLQSLKKDGHDVWYGIDGYLYHLFGELLQPLPAMLLELNTRAKNYADSPSVVGQPNSPNAWKRFLIRAVSGYFMDCYGQRLHAQTAAVATAVLQEDISEDRVRALIRIQERSRPTRTRRKVETARRKVYGSKTSTD